MRKRPKGVTPNADGGIGQLHGHLVYETCREKSRQKVIQAVSPAPLYGAVLSQKEVSRMCKKLFEVNKNYPGDSR